MALLEVKDLGIYFHTRSGVIKAVDGVSFDLNKGETLGIVGESGSGKSICCLSLMGLLPSPPAQIESGSALFEGLDLPNLKDKSLRQIRSNRIAMVFQDPMTALNPYMRIGEQVIEPLLLHQNMSKAQAREKAIVALEEVGITNPEQGFDAYPHEFSGGMRQRVMIAMALICDPDILIADEPTTALDVTVQAQILDLFRQIQAARDIAIIFISHDLGVIAGIADKVLVMQNGRVVDQGTVDNIFYKNQNTYTQALLNAIPNSAKPEKYKISRSINTPPLFVIKDLETHYQHYDKSLFSGKQTRTNKAVDGVSLQLNKGEVLGLVGESGCGKSTLAKSIMRLLKINAGSIQLDGKDLVRLEGEELRLSRVDFQMIFQDPYASLNPRMTVFETLREACLIQRHLQNESVAEAVYSLLDDVNLDQADANRYPHEFSGGQRQRIAIARTLALRPKLLIADEPVSALDVTIQAQILSLLLELIDKYQISLIFISHDLSVVRYVSDRLAVMYAGQIVESGITESVFTSPQHDYTKALLSAIPLADPDKERKRLRLIVEKPSQ